MVKVDAPIVVGEAFPTQQEESVEEVKGQGVVRTGKVRTRRARGGSGVRLEGSDEACRYRGMQGRQGA